MRVLVTNDDGVEAPGLRALACAIADVGHDVVVVAPAGERSGSGAAIGRLHRSGPIPWTPVVWPDRPGISVHAHEAPPAATVYAGCMGAFGPAPDVVASGVNPGMNYGHLVLHSGTVGAALTARELGIPAVAVSIAWGDEEHFDTAAMIATDAVEWIATQSGAPMVANINVPNVALEHVRGVRGAKLCRFTERWSAETTPGELHLEYVGHGTQFDPDSDLAVVSSGAAAVTLLEGVAQVAGNATVPARALARALDTRVMCRGVA